MTERLYDYDSYSFEFEAEITDAFVKDGKNIAVLDRTCFFPEGGGQPSDTGKIGSLNVSYVFEEDGNVYHCTDSLAEKNTKALCRIDFDRRFLFMQIHSGEHILSGRIQSLFGIKNVGFHIGNGFNTIDLDKELSEEMVRKAEIETNMAIWKNEPVKSYYPSKEELEKLPLRKKSVTDKPLRVVIAGTSDVCACCGTHVARTAEIGLVKIIKHEKYKGGTRITFLCGSQALEDYEKKNALLKEAGKIFSLPPEDVMKGIGKLKSSLEEEKAKTAALCEKLVSVRASEIIKGMDEKKAYVGIEDGFSAKELLMLSEKITSAEESSVFLFGDDKFVFASSSGMDMRQLASSMAKEFKTRGGGRPSMVQGAIGDNAAEPLCVWVRGQIA